MSALLAVYLRELRSYFVSPLAWVVLTVFLLANGWIFGTILGFLTDPRGTPIGSPLEIFFLNNFLSWIVLIVVCPLLTMRLLAEERKTGTIEMLMTAPVTEVQVVVGKLAAALTFYAFLWLPTATYAVAIAVHDAVDPGPLASGYLGVLGVGALFLSWGLFASSMSRNQLVAAVVAFVGLFAFFFPSLLTYLVIDETQRALLEHVDLVGHMEDFARGIVDTRALVLYASASAFFVFLSSRALAANKWR